MLERLSNILVYMYLIEKTILDYEQEIVSLRQRHITTCIKYEKYIKELKEIIEEMKLIYNKIPDDEEGEASSFYDNA